MDEEIYKMIFIAAESHGYTPTMARLAERMGVQNYNKIAHSIDRLEKAGRVKSTGNRNTRIFSIPDRGYQTRPVVQKNKSGLPTQPRTKDNCGPLMSEEKIAKLYKEKYTDLPLKDRALDKFEIVVPIPIDNTSGIYGSSSFMCMEF